MTVSALVLLLCEGDGWAVWGLGGRREVDGMLLELVPEMLVLIFLPEARPKDLLGVFCPERVLGPALGSRC